MKKNKIVPFLPLLFIAAQTLFLITLDYTFLRRYNVVMFTFALVFLGATSFATAFFYGYLRRWKKKKKLFFAFLAVAVCPGVTPALIILFLHTLFPVPQEVTSYVYLATTTVFFAVFFVLQSVELGKRKVRKLYTAVVSTLTVCLFSVQILLPVFTYFVSEYQAPAVAIRAYQTKDSQELVVADFYIANDGNDENDGSLEAPFATFDKAKEEVRKLDKGGRSSITVAVKAGEYRMENLSFAEEDGGTESCPITYCAYGDGEVILNGGITLESRYRTALPAQTASRLQENARKNVLCYDLTQQGITTEMLGKIYAVGSYNTAAKYDGDYVGGIYCELFYNDKRMTLARYPDTGFLQTGKVIEMGEGLESDGSKTKNPNWETIRNPKSDTYSLSDELTARIASWKTLDDVWMFGFWKYTWADASTPVGDFNPVRKTLTTKFVSLYGAIEDAPYYFFNVLEELDTAGEWYLDRENCLLYLYAPDTDENATIDLSLSTKDLITVNCDFLTLRGFTVKGTRGNGIQANGNRITINKCLIKNVSEHALVMNGTNNTASENEITHTGKGGIYLSGGDTVTLQSGKNEAVNNLIHDWSEIYQTYQLGVYLSGVGNICRHNEFYNSPHTAVAYAGNNHLIEYNDIHDVCLLSDDAGAVYSGRKWTWYGNVIRYNAIYNLGSDGHTPSGIYMDDALSGQTVYGNLLVNIPGNAIQLGGGRDLIVENNIIVNCNVPISYDDRAREGMLHNGWFDHAVENGEMWQDLYDSAWQSEAWQNAFPAYRRFSSDKSDTENKDLFVNPAYSIIENNLILTWALSVGKIDSSCYRFSTITDNYCGWPTQTDFFEDYNNGKYGVTEKIYDVLPDFQPIPVDEIGRTAQIP